MAVPDQPAEFGALVAKHLPDMLRLALRLAGRPAAAEEVVSEALYRAARSQSSCRDLTRIRAWLWKIVLRSFQDLLARESHHHHLTLPDDLVDRRNDEPAARADAADLAAHVARLVAQLPPRQREVLVLTVYEGLSVAEVAEILEIAPGNVHVNLHHARATLRRQLADQLLEK